MERYKIVFLGDNLYSWGGGIDYLCQIVCSYAYIAHHFVNVEIDMHAIMPYVENPTSEDAVRKNILVENLLRIEPSMKVWSLKKEETTKDKVIELRPDYVIPYHCGVFRGLSIPYISYIPDFQEEYYKNYFTAYDIVMRRQRNAFILSHAPYILATSNSVASDIRKFYPKASAHIFVQPFAPLSSVKYWNTKDADIAKYQLPNKYFIVSNQFWMHKDHMTAFKAIKRLVEIGYKDVCLVCTGKMADYRNNSYQRELSAFINGYALENNIRLLGYIPKEEQVEVLKNALALIQPSRFEGDPGGCSVYEAVCYGKIVVMSDTPVNLEARGTKDIYYFKTGDSKELALQMERLMNIDIKPYAIETAQEIYEMNAPVMSKFYIDMMRCVVKR